MLRRQIEIGLYQAPSAAGAKPGAPNLHTLALRLRCADRCAKTAPWDKHIQLRNENMARTRKALSVSSISQLTETAGNDRDDAGGPRITEVYVSHRAAPLVEFHLQGLHGPNFHQHS